MTLCLILQLEGKDKEISRRTLYPHKSSVQQRGPIPKLGGSIQDCQSIDPKCISISSFEWRLNTEIVECRLFENLLSMIVCIFVNKVHNLRIEVQKLML